MYNIHTHYIYYIYIYIYVPINLLRLQPTHRSMTVAVT